MKKMQVLCYRRSISQRFPGNFNRWQQHIRTKTALLIFSPAVRHVSCPFMKLLQMIISACQPCSERDKAGGTKARLLSREETKAP